MRKKRAFPKEFFDPFSAPQALQISSLEALESSRRALSNGSKLDIRSSRGAEYRSINYLRKPEKSQILSNFSKLFPSVLGTTEFCIEFDQNFKFFDRPKTGALYFCHMIIGSEQNERVGYEDMSERPGRDILLGQTQTVKRF